MVVIGALRILEMQGCAGLPRIFPFLECLRASLFNATTFRICTCPAPLTPWYNIGVLPTIVVPRFYYSETTASCKVIEKSKKG
jgi:hypothetical protein